MWVTFNSEGYATVQTDKPDKPNILKTVVVYIPQAKHRPTLRNIITAFQRD